MYELEVQGIKHTLRHRREGSKQSFFVLLEGWIYDENPTEGALKAVEPFSKHMTRWNKIKTSHIFDLFIIIIFYHCDSRGKHLQEIIIFDFSEKAS